MADPLINDDFADVESRSRSAAADSAQVGGSAYQPPLEDPIRKGNISPERELPEAGSSQLNRTARQVGGAIGGVVSQARRLPDSARRGLHLVRDRAQELGEQTAGQISGSASSLAGNAQERIRGLQDTARQAGERAQQRAGELMDLAEERARVLLDKTRDKTDELATYFAGCTEELKQEIDQRGRELSNNARVRVYEMRLRARHTVREYPLETLGCVAGAAFILGVALRITRSHNANRY
jgi:ElaB/YqjD/DUF883 family membrane-anchored ribosome-binding protein